MYPLFIADDPALDFRNLKIDNAMLRPDDSADWNDVLGLPCSASKEEVKAAYLEALKRYHPDQVAQLGPKLRELAESETKRINDAFSQARQAKGF